MTRQVDVAFSGQSPPSSSPASRGYRWPAEWERHRTTWLVWPHNTDTWPDRLDLARREFAQFVGAITRFESVDILAVGAARADAEKRLKGNSNVHFHSIATNDSWIRDHGPIFLSGPDGQPSAIVDAGYNAWGGKYPPYDLDQQVPKAIAATRNVPRFAMPIILEGGAVDGNGQGILLSTERALLNKNRNPHLDRPHVERYLRDYFAASSIIWLTGVIPGDDTDGHVDQIARFVDDQTIVVTDLPGTDLFCRNRARIEAWSNQHGRHLNIASLPAPVPRQVDQVWLPASYANFYFVNDALLVPTFRDPADDQALARLERLLPQRTIVPVAAETLIMGLGALHCLSQQEPANDVI